MKELIIFTFLFSRPFDESENLKRIECEVNNFPAVSTTLSLVEMIAEELDVPGLPENDTISTAGIAIAFL